MIDDLLTPTGPPASAEVRERIYRRTRAYVHRRRPAASLAGLLAACAAGLMLLTPLRPPQRPTPTDAVGIEWRALEGDPRLYRTAADRYLDEGRADEAVRCYGHALDAGGDLEVRPGDSAILMAIKAARTREANE